MNFRFWENSTTLWGLFAAADQIIIQLDTNFIYFFPRFLLLCHFPSWDID